jgi:flavorubredoxin
MAATMKISLLDDYESRLARTFVHNIIDHIQTTGADFQIVNFSQKHIRFSELAL